MTEIAPSLESTPSRKVRLSRDVLLQELEGEAVLLHLQTELYLGLNESGTRILKRLEVADSIDAAFRLLLQEYEVEPEHLRVELDRLLKDLHEQGIIETVED